MLLTAACFFSFRNWNEKLKMRLLRILLCVCYWFRNFQNFVPVLFAHSSWLFPKSLKIVTIVLHRRFQLIMMRYILLASIAVSDFLSLVLTNSFIQKDGYQRTWRNGKQQLTYVLSLRSLCCVFFPDLSSVCQEYSSSSSYLSPILSFAPVHWAIQ